MIHDFEPDWDEITRTGWEVPVNLVMRYHEQFMAHLKTLCPVCLGSKRGNAQPIRGKDNIVVSYGCVSCGGSGKSDRA